MQKLKLIILLFVYITTINNVSASELTGAISENNISKIQELMNKGVNVNEKDQHGFTPLIIATGLGNKKIVEILLKSGADSNILENQMGTSALHKVSQSGNIEIAELLLEHGAFINLQSPTTGHTPLIDAIWHEKEGLVKYFLSHDANPDIVASDGFTALNTALKTNNPKVFISLLENNKKRREKHTASLKLFNAVKERKLNKAKDLISKGCDLNKRALNGMNPLLQASLQGDAEIVEALLNKGADISIKDYAMRATPAHKAGYIGHPEVMKLLIKYGVDINAQGPYNGYTALHDAIWHRHSETAKILIEAGARLDLKTHNGKTPTELASELGFYEIEKMIREKGFHLN